MTYPSPSYQTLRLLARLLARQAAKQALETRMLSEAIVWGAATDTVPPPDPPMLATGTNTLG